MKILNLYAGIGGNRKLWGDEHEITAVEFNPEIAAVYKALYPNDIVIIGDAHEYLRKHFMEFDIVWTSPPCPSHSRLNTMLVSVGNEYRFPDMKLYEEIIFLKHFFKGYWIVENVIPYYEPLIKPQIIDRHCFWANFNIPNEDFKSLNVCGGNNNAKVKDLEAEYGFNLSEFKLPNKLKALRNCVRPETGLHILNSALGKVLIKKRLTDTIQYEIPM